MIRLDMSEFMERHGQQADRFSPGYVGFNEGGQLKLLAAGPIPSFCLTKSRKPTPMSSTCCCSCLKTANDRFRVALSTSSTHL